MEQVLSWLGETIPWGLWNIVRWITFFFKIISLAFVVPIIGLIIFDFCLWLWRLYRPPLPVDSPRSARLPKDYVQQPPPSPNKACTTAPDLELERPAAERRAAYKTLADR
ncbi:hypothetical protein F5Y12DRAFT_488562 [Xylaria sp. FL1777]|nr:hypothetical protein F5Y12DRAFT_488562 [Xylaria sp. FL1777]